MLLPPRQPGRRDLDRADERLEHRRDPAAAELANQNAALNEISDRMEVINADIAQGFNRLDRPRFDWATWLGRSTIHDFQSPSESVGAFNMRMWGLAFGVSRAFQDWRERSDSCPVGPAHELFRCSRR